MQATTLAFLDLLDGQKQYVVPRWQRRYCWGEADIERLVADLAAIGGAAENDAAHYGGALLTFPEPGDPGVVSRIRVVDGQQRLTTVSILLACIGKKLGADGDCEGWTAEIIRNDRLLNPGKSPELARKLRLQDGDEEDYRRFLADEGQSGPGAVPQACRIAGRLVAETDLALLLRGLRRFRVVGVNLGASDDPQQIFESLNATGKPLTESEKVKNWLLMGLDEDTQQELHVNGWRRIEEFLDAAYESERIDLFLRDLLRWKTGRVVGGNRVYDEFRRWARSTGNPDRSALCRELVEYARLYGLLTGAAGRRHENRGAERALRHLRDLGLGAHRPLTLRLLHDASLSRTNGNETWAEDELAPTLEGIGAWLTRLWLADRPVNGLNRATAKLAHGLGPQDGESFTDHWRDRIRGLRHTAVAVPTDEQVAHGIRTRNAYGGSSSQASMAVLCALMEAEHREEAPARDRDAVASDDSAGLPAKEIAQEQVDRFAPLRGVEELLDLELEHIMPRKLGADWRRALGEDAENIRRRVGNLLPNLTLCSAAMNASLGNRPFAEKRKLYGQSPIGMTRRLADEENWDEDALERRAEDLTNRATHRWPWTDPKQATGGAVHDHKELRRLFWRLLRERTGVGSGKGNLFQQSGPLNPSGDRIHIALSKNYYQIQLWGRAVERSPERTERMRRYSHRIHEDMGDQDTVGDSREWAEEGWTIGVVRPFYLTDRDEWPEAADWIKEQYERLVAIVSD